MNTDSNEQDQIHRTAVPGASTLSPAVPTFAESRQAYVDWLKSLPTDAFAPATHDEVLALYDKNCAPESPAAGAADLALVTPTFARSYAGFSAWLSSPSPTTHAHTTYAEYLAMWDEHFGRAAEVAGDEKADAALPSRNASVEPAATGFTLDVALVHLRSRAAAPQPPSEPRTTIQDLIARSESIPHRKAALDRARARRALGRLQGAAIKAMTPGEVVTELCKTPAGRAQYDAITQREAGVPYSPPHLDSGLTIEEVVVGLFNTPEGRAEFEATGREFRTAMGLSGTGEELLTSVAKASLFLLQHARQSLSDGLESDCDLEAEWSKEDKALVARIDAVLSNHLAKALLKDM